MALQGLGLPAVISFRPSVKMEKDRDDDGDDKDYNDDDVNGDDGGDSDNGNHNVCH